MVAGVVPRWLMSRTSRPGKLSRSFIRSKNSEEKLNWTGCEMSFNVILLSQIRINLLPIKTLIIGIITQCRIFKYEHISCYVQGERGGEERRQRRRAEE